MSWSADTTHIPEQAFEHRNSNVPKVDDGNDSLSLQDLCPNHKELESRISNQHKCKQFSCSHNVPSKCYSNSGMCYEPWLISSAGTKIPQAQETTIAHHYFNKNSAEMNKLLSCAYVNPEHHHKMFLSLQYDPTTSSTINNSSHGTNLPATKRSMSVDFCWFAPSGRERIGRVNDDALILMVRALT